MTCAELSQIETLLAQNQRIAERGFWSDICQRTEDALQDAIAHHDDAHANKAWLLDSVAHVYRDYLACFDEMQRGNFYEAWCGLERIELGIKWLLKNPFLELEAFGIPKFGKLVSTWQSLYPYKVFISPGLIHKEKKCSICDARISPWTNCGHEGGKVYGGRLCHRIVTSAEFTEISLVLDPVQKYSVAFAAKDDTGGTVDHHDHSLARFVVERLISPLDRWDVVWTLASHPHSMFPDAGPDGPCPCESGRTYDACCLKRKGIMRPHAQIIFHESVMTDLPSAEFAGYGERNGPARLTLPRERGSTS